MVSQIELILFDIGGVLVELGDISTNTAWFKPELSPKENWDLWLTAPKSHALEKGEVSPREFAVDFIKENNLAIDVDTFLQKFRDWVIGFYPGAIELIQTLSQTHRLGVFSNITEVHWPSIEKELIQSGAISDYFASYLIGQAKPDVQAFQFVADKTGVLPKNIFFLDDNLINVQGARKAGLAAEVVKDPNGVRGALEKHGIYA